MQISSLHHLYLQIDSEFIKSCLSICQVFCFLNQLILIYLLLLALNNSNYLYFRLRNLYELQIQLLIFKAPQIIYRLILDQRQIQLDHHSKTLISSQNQKRSFLRMITKIQVYLLLFLLKKLPQLMDISLNQLYF